MIRISGKALSIAMVIGILFSLGTGVVENQQIIGIPENTYYGFPVIWRVVSHLQSPIQIHYVLDQFVINTLVWVGLALVGGIVITQISIQNKRP